MRGWLFQRQAAALALAMTAGMISVVVQGCDQIGVIGAGSGGEEGGGVDRATQKKKPVGGSKPLADQATPRIDPDSLLPDRAALLEATYTLTAKAAGIDFCDGQVSMRINAAIGKNANTALFELPDPTLDCTLVGKLNLTPILGLFSKSANLPKPVVRDNVLSFKQLGNGTYTPERPLLPSFLATSREDLAHLAVTRQVSLTDSRFNKTASGTMAVNVTEFGVPATAAGHSFNDTFTFKIVNTGFDGLDKPANVIFDEMTFTISLNPLAVLAISFKGDAKSLKATAAHNPEMIPGIAGELLQLLPDSETASGPLAKLLAGAIDGVAALVTVEVTMDLSRQGGLDSPVATDGSDDGVVVGH